MKDIQEIKQIQKMKVGKTQRLFYVITTLVSVLIVCFILLLISLVFYSQRKHDLEQQVNILRKQNSNISLQVDDIINKSITTKNYIQIWNEKFSEVQKELKGVNTSDVYATISATAKQSKLVNVSISFSPLILVGGIFEKQNIKVFSTLVTIKFSSITDIDVLSFLDSLKQTKKYFFIVQEINLKRTGKISDEFIETLNNGNIVTAVDGEIKIRIYGLEVK